MPWRYKPDGSAAVTSPPKEKRRFDGTEFVLETAIRCDFALVRAAVADRHGNLAFSASARNFNPLCAMAGTISIAEAETIVDVGDLPADRIDLPGVFVQRVVQADSRPKLIEKRTVRQRGSEA
jgi:3-oxoacid CoA-transferase subunit A